MRRFRLLLLLLLVALLPRAQAEEDTLGLDELLDIGRRVVEQALEPETIESLEELAQANQAHLEAIARSIQSKFQGDYVVDLVAVRPLAEALLPALERFPESAPYAGWLRAEIDFFTVAQELALTLPAPPLTTPDVSIPRPPTNPPAAMQREIWIQTTAKRELPKEAGTQVARLKPIFAAFGVPEELVWIAEVESSFQRDARSPAGAVGLYQLMANTAKAQGLVVEPRDERLHPEKSARGAAALLKHLHGRFGDWRLVLAAYNAGEGRVQRLLEQTRGRSFDDIFPRLPAETQLYVPKVEALVRRREGKALSDLVLP